MDRAQQRTIREGELDERAAITLDEALHAGSIVDGRYRLEHLLGEGGTGSVWQATHLQMQSPVALKILLHELRSREGAIARFWQEARMMGSLGHPNIVRVLDVSPTRAPAPYMAMELLRGGSLYRQLKQHGPMDSVKACSLMDGVLSALRCAHHRGIVHRDIKPENLLFGEVRDLATDDIRNELKILDFGASILLGKARKHGDSLWGTPYYMSPEQAANSELDHRSDLYSAAVVLYELIAGKLPHAGNTVHAIIYSIATEPAIPIATYCPDLPPAFHSFFERALARRPEDRFSTALDMRAALRKITGKKHVHTRDTQVYMAVASVEHPSPVSQPHPFRPDTIPLRQQATLDEPSDLRRAVPTPPRFRVPGWLGIAAIASLLPALVAHQWHQAVGDQGMVVWRDAAISWLLSLVVLTAIIRVRVLYHHRRVAERRRKKIL